MLLWTLTCIVNFFSFIDTMSENPPKRKFSATIYNEKKISKHLHVRLQSPHKNQKSSSFRIILGKYLQGGPCKNCHSHKIAQDFAMWKFLFFFFCQMIKFLFFKTRNLKNTLSEIREYFGWGGHRFLLKSAGKFF